MIAIVTDSTIYLKKQDAIDMGIHIVPMSYVVGARVLHEHYSDTNGEFQKVINSFKCTTAQPSSSAFMSTFEELRRKGYEIICLVISSRLSGTYSSALTAAKEVDRDKIRIVDSLTTTGGLRFLAERAKELIEEGCALEEIALDLEQMRDRISIAFSVENMDPLRRSGRLGFVRQSIGTILNTRPILMCVDGTIVSHGFSRGRHQQIAKLVAAIPKDAKKINVQCLGCETAAAALTVAIKSEFPGLQPSLNMIGPVLAIHLGIPTLGVGWLK